MALRIYKSRSLQVYSQTNGAFPFAKIYPRYDKIKSITAGKIYQWNTIGVLKYFLLKMKQNVIFYH